MTSSTNYEVLVAWLVFALQSGYAQVVPRVEAVLGEVGRMKFLRPLYSALARDPQLRPVARQLFERLRPRYHPIARQVVESLLREAS
ncbi:MAG: leukotriene A4 hydrolase C-terminal domain-containing protein [Kofleriaceae bacterium]